METTGFIRPQTRPNRTVRVKPKQRSKGRSKGNQKETRRNEPQGSVVTLRPTVGSQTVRRKFAATGSILSTAAGAVTLSSTGCNDLITSLGSEWSNYAQEYSEFRIVKLGIHFLPCTTSATSTTGPYQGGLAVCPWAQLKIASLASLHQSDQLMIFSTLEEKIVMVTGSGMSNTKLWNPVGTALPIDRDFGITYVNEGTLAVSSNIYVAVFELFAEFKVPF